MPALNAESASGAHRLLDRAIEELFRLSELVQEEAPDEHLGYVATITPALEGAFSMLRVIHEALPELAPREDGPIQSVEFEDLGAGNPSYRWANSMTLATAEKVTGAVRSVASLLQQAMDLLASAGNVREKASLEASSRGAAEALQFILVRLEVQHPGVTKPR